MAINVNIPKPTYTTAEVADSVDARYVTDAELTVIQNTSGTNTGDQDLSGYVPYTGATASVDLNTNDLIFGAGAGVLLNNTSRLREGTIDAGTGGTKGIAQICAVGYELKWEAGSQYVMDGNGVLVRIVNYKFNIAPTVNNDDTEGFYVGSRWILDDGTIYTCSDSTTGAAVWDLNSGFVPYTGATANVDLGTFNLEATTLVKTGGLATEFLMADGTTTTAITFLNPRVQTVASSATVTPTSTNDLVKITAQAAGLTLANPTGTFAEGQALIIRIKDNATARAITYGTNYRAIGVTLPTTTVLSKTTYLGIIYNDSDSKWDVVGVTTQA